MKTLVVAALLLLGTLGDANVIGKRRPTSRRTVLAPRILYLEHCKDTRKHYLVIHNFSSLVDGRGVMYVNTFMEWSRTAKTLSMMKVVLHRCREAVTSNTCEYFATWPFTAAICTMVTAKGMMWSGFLRSFHPEFKCPLNKGIYQVVNATVDVSLGETMSHINIAGNVWTVEVTLTDENKQLFSCLRTGILINRVNIKD